MKPNKDKKLTYDLLKAMESDGYVDSVEYMSKRSISYRRCESTYVITFPNVVDDPIVIYKNHEVLQGFLSVDDLHIFWNIFYEQIHSQTRHNRSRDKNSISNESMLRGQTSYPTNERNGYNVR